MKYFTLADSRAYPSLLTLKACASLGIIPVGLVADSERKMFSLGLWLLGKYTSLMKVKALTWTVNEDVDHPDLLRAWKSRALI